VSDDQEWTDHVPDWLVRTRKLSVFVVLGGMIPTAVGLGTGEAVLVALGMALVAAPLFGVGVVDLVRPRWGHHAGFRRYHEPTAEAPEAGDLRKIRLNGVVVLVAAVLLVSWFLLLSA
jgi:hypothetical protein